ncbi:hypothetical protein SAMN04487965_2644 [Microbulbifer donghaiensis]|uniref:Uncharacterized protein n=1 Tax=Microbulbifer donghaiensis TaxID=494016 RepID=A0A1M5EBE5_9GAMM|nr:hypothetical protein SAMN04487965_2644 [Microbulbifer donghaiensis]
MIGILLAGALAVAPAVLLAQPPLVEGIAAFRGGLYRKALELFEEEARGGNDSARLKYNIGVTLMKLRRYEEAGVYFQQLLQEPEWRDLARYNFALAAERNNRRIIAAKHYRQVSETSDSQKLRSLAATRLNALAAMSRRAGVKRWIGTASLSAGRDDNAYALQNALLKGSSVGADNFAEIFAWGQYQLEGITADGWRLHGYGYGRRYDEYDSLDLSSVSAALSRDRRWRGWLAEVGVSTEFIFLGGQQVTRQVQLLGRLTRDFGPSNLTLAYIPGYYLGGDDYAYLDGWRQRFEVRWQRPLLAAQARIFYRYDANDRADQVRDSADYYSYSPLRHSFGGVLDWSLSGNWLVTTGVEYRSSAYDGANRTTDIDGNVLTYRRESDRLKSWLATTFKLTPRLSLDGKFIVIDNEESLDSYTYDKTELSFGVRYIF